MKLMEEQLWPLLKQHLQQTLTYWSVFFSFGLCVSFLGPTILDLRCQTGATVEQITWVFFSQQFFLLVGSCVGGLFKKTLLASLLALFFCTLMISLLFAAIPFCHHIVPLFVTMAITGGAMGVIDTIANYQLVNLYQKNSAVFLQSLHFFIGLGALISPLVADPFLTDDNCTLETNRTPNYHHVQMNTSEHEAARLDQISTHGVPIEGEAIGSVSYAFWIMALINLPVPVAVFTLMYQKRLLPCFRKGPGLLEGRSGGSSLDAAPGSVFSCCSPANLRGLPPSFFLIHALGGAILFLTDGIMGSYAGFVYTYAVSPPLLMGHKAAGCLDSIFWASITIGRLGFIFMSYRFTAPRLLTFSLEADLCKYPPRSVTLYPCCPSACLPEVGAILVQFMLMIFYTSWVFLFIGTCVLGLCISSMFPSMLAFTEDILDYKGCATTVLVTSASTGEMLLQVVFGSVIQREGSFTFLLCCTTASVTALCCFLLFLYVQHLHRSSRAG
ncbi:major facilitator superfamily domain-containing protein 4A isoform X2 [Takifugu rubripes]|nr:major facilitator superfamily domain-containing protein 4A-like isoform X2 [Takifugu rubripes]